jgi:hypothetical protein
MARRKIIVSPRDSEQEALEEIGRERLAGTYPGGPSRAHPPKHHDHQKKIGGTMPRKGGRPR